MKTDFSDWLIVSDVDGTLNTKLRMLPERNLKAITHFVEDLGGNFTLASGRNISSLRKHYERLPIKSTPAVILNGAGIYDYENEKMLSFHSIDERGIDIVRRVNERFPLIQIEICTDREIFILNPGVFSGAMSLADGIPHQSFRKFEDVPKSNWGKVIFMGLPPMVSRMVKYFNSIDHSGVTYMSSSVASYEMLLEGTNKGTTVLEIADMLGIPHEHTGAIGDYFNDYDMIKSVGVPAVCGQAPQAMKDAATFVACHCNHGAVADFLEYIENNCQ